MGFWDQYRASLKPKEVEEPLDRSLFRPLAYPVARALLPVRAITPTMLTVTGILVGIVGTAVICLDFPYHLQIGGVLVILTMVLDCADGMLARMRKASTALGRMLDGMADLVVTVGLSGATVYVVARQYASPTWLLLALMAASAVTVVTSSFHLAMFDHCKNVWLRFTDPTFKEDDGEPYERALRRWEASKDSENGLLKLIWRTYLFYTKSQRDFFAWFDQAHLPNQPYDPELAPIYKRHMATAWAWIRSFCGSASLGFGLAVFNALEVPVYYLLLRLTVFNLLFFGVCRPLMIKATRGLRTELDARGLDKTKAVAV